MSNYQDGFNDGYLRAVMIIIKQLALELANGEVTNDLITTIVKRTKLSPRRLIREYPRLYRNVLAGFFEHAVLGTYKGDGRRPKPSTEARP